METATENKQGDTSPLKKGTGVIFFSPMHVEIGGSINAGLLLSHLMACASEAEFKEFCKTDAELCEEICFSVKKLRGAKAKLIEKGFIEIKRKGLPAKSHYTINSQVHEDFYLKQVEDVGGIKDE